MSQISNFGKHVAEYVYDFSVDGGVNGTAIDLSAKDGKAVLPQNAVVTEVVARVITAVTSDGSATVEWGNVTDSNGYSGTAIAKGTLVADYVINSQMGKSALLWDDTNDNQIPFLVNSANDASFKILINTADLTAGKIAFYVEYYLHSVNA